MAVLQDLCPRCGIESVDGTRACAACGFEPDGPRPPARAWATGRAHLRPILLTLTALLTAGVVIISGSGFRPPSPSASPNDSASPQLAHRAALAPAPGLGRVVFGERLSASLELESHRTRFAAGDTIAWRAEFADAPRADELTVVVAWQSVRERMELSRDTVTLPDAGPTRVVSDEVPLDDLVPTAGLYSVSYYDGKTKLAEGVFELLPSDR